MELRELRAFVTASRELHFARAAEQLYMSPSTMSELIRKLEGELGAELFIRTTRRVTLTAAGSELLGRAETILGLVEQATAAVGAIQRDGVGHIRVGITPSAGPVIAPHLARCFTARNPDVSIDIQRMWLPALGSALRTRAIDVAITCGSFGAEQPHLGTATLGSEPLLVALRPDHPLADQPTIDLEQLAHDTLGMHPANLFPAWHAVQRQILARAALAPPVADLDDADLAACRWTEQPEVQWIMLTASLLANRDPTTVRPVTGHVVPFTLSWHTTATRSPVVWRFVQSSLRARLPPGWLPPPHNSPR